MMQALISGYHKLHCFYLQTLSKKVAFTCDLLLFSLFVATGIFLR